MIGLLIRGKSLTGALASLPGSVGDVKTTPGLSETNTAQPGNSNELYANTK